MATLITIGGAGSAGPAGPGGGIAPDAPNVTAVASVVYLQKWNSTFYRFTGTITIFLADANIGYLKSIHVMWTETGGTPIELATVYQPSGGWAAATADFVSADVEQPRADTSGTLEFLCENDDGKITASPFELILSIIKNAVDSVVAVERTGGRHETEQAGSLTWVDVTPTFHAGQVPNIVTIWLDEDDGQGWKWKGWWIVENVGDSIGLEVWLPTSAGNTSWQVACATGAIFGEVAVPGYVATNTFTVDQVAAATATLVPSASLTAEYALVDPGFWVYTWAIECELPDFLAHPEFWYARFTREVGGLVGGVWTQDTNYPITAVFDLGYNVAEILAGQGGGASQITKTFNGGPWQVPSAVLGDGITANPYRTIRWRCYVGTRRNGGTETLQTCWSGADHFDFTPSVGGSILTGTPVYPRPEFFTIGTLSYRCVDTETGPAVEILVPVTPPGPIGTVIGGHIYAEGPDRSSGPRFGLGGSTLGSGDLLSGAWQPQDIGQFPYYASDQPWRVRVPGLTSVGVKATSTVRIYVESYSAFTDFRPIQAGLTDETPSATVTIQPYQSTKPNSGSNVSTLLVTGISAVALDPVKVSGKLVRPIAVTVDLSGLPTDLPADWAYQIIGYKNGDFSTGAMMATGYFNRDTTADPLPAGPDGIDVPHTLGVDEPTETTKVVLYAVAGSIMTRPVRRGSPPGTTADPSFVGNNIVSGITASCEITIGTLTGVIDLTNAMLSSYSAEFHMDPLTGKWTINTVDMTKASNFSAQFAVSSGAFRVAQISADLILTGLLQVGGPGMVSQMKNFDTSGNLIGWIGDDTANSGYVGAWFKRVLIGGTSPATAKIIADAAGNVAIDGALIAGALSGVTLSLAQNGIITTIDNHAFGSNRVGLEVQDVATGNAALVSSLAMVLYNTAPANGKVSASMAYNGSAGIVKAYDGSGTGQIDTHGLRCAMDGSNGNISANGAFHAVGGAAYFANGNQVLTVRQSAIASPSVSASSVFGAAGAAYTATEQSMINGSAIAIGNLNNSITNIKTAIDAMIAMFAVHGFSA